MKKKIIKIQDNLTKFYRSFNKNRSLFYLSKDNCSEISRIVGYWFLKNQKNTKACILKGDNIKFGKKQSHDLLLILEKNKLFLIDPTVWQFFRYKKSIFWGEFNKMSEIFIFLKLKYGGKWKISERVEKEEIKKILVALKKIVRENIKN